MKLFFLESQNRDKKQDDFNMFFLQIQLNRSTDEKSIGERKWRQRGKFFIAKKRNLRKKNRRSWKSSEEEEKTKEKAEISKPFLSPAFAVQIEWLRHTVFLKQPSFFENFV